MEYIANTAFQPKVTNGIFNSLQNVAGKYGAFEGDEFTPADCSAGFLVKETALLPLEGYASVSKKNGNSWYMEKAEDGKAKGVTGDHTGIFAANSYNVNQVGAGDLRINFGAQTLGLGIPADDIGTFTELLVGESYKFGLGNFASEPTEGQYVAIANGLFAASSETAPTEGVYGQVLYTEAFNEGTHYAGDGYIVKIFRA